VVVIEFDRVSKSFPGVQALADVSLTIAAGTCHALLGENGAGKSTLGKILAGIEQPDAGEIRLADQVVRFASPREASVAGIGIVHQELVFCPNLSVAENLCLHDLPRRGLTVDRQAMRQRARAALAQLDLAIDVDRPVQSLSIAQEQLVQVAAAISQGARILIFDEPTSSLGQHEVMKLFELIRRLQADGVTVIYISHRLEEIFELCQALTVLRDGRVVATKPVAETTRDELVRLMVGRELQTSAHSDSPTTGAVRLRVESLNSPGKFQGVSFEVRSGEIVGLAGLVGAGRTEIAQAIYGLDPAVSGKVVLSDRAISLRSPRAALREGIALVPEDRKRAGLVLGLSVRENVTLPLVDRFRRWLGAIDRRSEATFADVERKRFNIRTASVEAPVQTLSGGNQQKVVLAKALACASKLLIVDEPTRGVDVGAKQEIHSLIRQAANRGLAVLIVSSDMPELLGLADRVLVLRAGQIVASLSRSEATAEAVGRAMTGGSAS
jgi:ABC-type sugar transport system ATPase subunit